MPDTSDTSAAQTIRVQYEWDTSNTSARRLRHECCTSVTQVLQERNECDTSATRTTRVGYEWKILFLITRLVKTYFNTFILALWLMKNYKERNNFVLRTTFWKCMLSMPKCVRKVHHKNWAFLIAKTVSKSYKIDCSCKCLCRFAHSYA